ncbi:hypothetical protein CCO04_26775 [Pimelobacter sp. 30-1]|nr:hypothetical protein [Pimelobacter sp. 30-1]
MFHGSRTRPRSSENMMTEKMTQSPPRNPPTINRTHDCCTHWSTRPCSIPKSSDVLASVASTRRTGGPHEPLEPKNDTDVGSKASPEPIISPTKRDMIAATFMRACY